jgi:kynurenine formamidase
MNLRLLKIQACVVAATLSIAILLFAAQTHSLGTGPQFRAVVDLTASTTLKVDLSSSRNTILVAPAKIGGVWTVDTLPATRLVAPLAVIEAQHKNFPDSESLVTMNDVADYERDHGAVPQGAIVLLTSKKRPTPQFSKDALHFLVEARNIVGIGNSGTEVASANDNPYLADKGIYELENVANLSLIPRSGVIAIAAPEKIDGASEGPVRLMSLVR